MTHLGSLTDEELISRVRTRQTATPLERELARRLADAIDAIHDRLSELEDVFDEIQTRKVDA